MKPTLKYYGYVEGGKMMLRRREAIATEVSSVYEGDDIEVSIKKHRSHRSNPQNRYYWGAVIPALVSAFIEIGHALQIGNAEHHELVHDLMKQKFISNGIELTDANGEVMQAPPSTRRLDKGEFSEYIENIRDWAADAMGVFIPAPDEQAELSFET
jgi:hypothetical protein